MNEFMIESTEEVRLKFEPIILPYLYKWVFIISENMSGYKNLKNLNRVIRQWGDGNYFGKPSLEN